MSVKPFFDSKKKYVVWGLTVYFLVTSLGVVLWAGDKILQKISAKIEKAEHSEKVKEFNALLSFDSGVIGKPSSIKVYDWESIDDIPAVQEDIRKRFLQVLGNRLPYRSNPEIKIQSSQKLQGNIERIIFTVTAEVGYEIKGCMLVPPSERPLPAVLLAYGLGGSLFHTCGWGIQSYHHDMGMGMAEKGIISISYVLRGLGHDGKDWGEPEWGPMNYRDFVGYTLQYGSSAMNVWVFDTLQILYAIQQYSKIDKGNVFVGGISHGGQIALYAGALEPQKIKGVLAMGSFVSYESLFTEIHNWTGHAIPGIASVGNMGDLAALIAPRPLLVQWGENDSTSPWAQLRPSSLAEFERVLGVYKKLQSLKNLQKVVTPKGGHEFEVNVAGDFISNHLQ